MILKKNTINLFFLSAVFLSTILITTIWRPDLASAAKDDEKILLPAYVQEQQISFTYRGGREAYHCDFIRAETTAILRQIGAMDIEVFCRGGLPYDRNNFVETRFTSVRQTTTEKSTRMGTITPVGLNFISSCDLHRVIIESVLLGFDTFELESSGTCRNAREPLNYQFKTLF